MATNKQVEHYEHMTRQAEHDKAIGMLPSKVEKVEYKGAWLVMVDGTVVDVLPFSDVWGNGR